MREVGKNSLFKFSLENVLLDARLFLSFQKRARERESERKRVTERWPSSPPCIAHLSSLPHQLAILKCSSLLLPEDPQNFSLENEEPTFPKQRRRRRRRRRRRLPRRAIIICPRRRIRKRASLCSSPRPRKRRQPRHLHRPN